MSVKLNDVIGIASTAKIAQSAPQQVSNGSIEQIITDAANKYGIDPNYAIQIARCESTLNKNAVNYNYAEIPGHHPSGLYQHLTNYWPARAAKYGYAGASVFDPVANANVTMGMWRDGAKGLWEC
ncbi:MAG TPA: transglycosylase SLT domain-containing protein [Pseudomonadales bacterium]|nr:transglycosylase SLT domain-containing protein [Pseudomonadales bacterium]